MRIKRLLHRQAHPDDQGLAMATVIIITFTISSLAIALTSLSVSALGKAANDEDWQAALNAANAGVSEYLSRLNEDGDYWKYRNPAAEYSASSSGVVDESNPFFIEWTRIPGTDPDGPRLGETRYEVDTSEYVSTGLIRLQSSGRVGNVIRTVETVLRRRSFIDYLYFTHFETVDPELYGNPQWADENCSRHYYSGRDNRCTAINFFSVDEIRGPLHSNDAILICGSPKFLGETSTSWDDPQGERYRKNNCTNQPEFERAGDPRYVEPLTLPPSNTALWREVNPTYSSEPGCLYTGPTVIELTRQGTMWVLSPWTPRTPACGGGAIKEEVDLPANGVVYVQNRPSGNDPYALPQAASCIGENCVGYPTDGDITDYDERAGDVFLSGELNGSLTIGAENNIVLVGDTTYESGDGGDDLLGLVAQNFIEVYHPVSATCTRYCGGRFARYSYSDIPVDGWGLNNEPDVYAAMLSVQHSIRAQNYNRGGRLGTLNIYGAMGQKYRGLVSTSQGATGYEKNYNYDYRLKYQSPPKFLDPVQSAFAISLWSEEDRAY